MLVANSVKLHLHPLGFLWLSLPYPHLLFSFTSHSQPLGLFLEDCPRATRLILPSGTESHREPLGSSLLSLLGHHLPRTALPSIKASSSKKIWSVVYTLGLPCRIMLMKDFAWNHFLPYLAYSGNLCVFPESISLIKHLHTILISECISGGPDLRYCCSFLQMRKLRLRYFKLLEVTLPVRAGVVTWPMSVWL